LEIVLKTFFRKPDVAAGWQVGCLADILSAEVPGQVSFRERTGFQGQADGVAGTAIG